MTPLMRQYHDIKSRYADEVVLFQVGDFYELFYHDAQRVSAFLGIVLTQRGTNNGEPIPLCGFPCHALDTYLIKLIHGGFRVVICDQANSPEAGKIIERTVSQVLTPGTLTDAKLLDEKSASYLASVVASDHAYGLIFVEILTGKVYATVTNSAHKKLLEAELSRFMPQEIIISQTHDQIEPFLRTLGYVTTSVRATQHYVTACTAWLQLQENQEMSHFIERSPVLITALQGLYAFLMQNNPTVLQNIQQIALYKPDDFLILDASTQRNLELVKSQDGSRVHTLFALLDRAATSMGSRMIKSWILRPLVDRAAIEHRLSSVQTLIEFSAIRDQLIGLLQTVGDVERIVGRIALRRALLQDYLQLMRCLKVMPELQLLIQQVSLPTLSEALELQQIACQEIFQLLSRALYDESEQVWSIKNGYSEELDRLRGLTASGSHAILALEQREQQLTGIASLKIRFNNAHGYGIEITKTHMQLVPDRYMRLQTLVNRERFITPELKELEYDMRRAQSDSAQIEKTLFEAVCHQVQQYVPALKQVVQILAELDGYIGFALSASEYQYVRPTFTTDRNMIVQQGRHPVVESKIRGSGRGQFIANDLMLTDAESLWIITGPNMGGKSTFLRQAALIVVMAQAGSFVPAAWAQLPLFDRIFTRIGAADNVAQGKSTFWVEMEETALICQEATEKSLVILDEVGRGTSTYDGLAVAQAVLEYIYEHIKARCLFATHYHELTELTHKHEGIVSYHASSRKTAEGIALLHKIQKGCAQSSFGIDVARSAQLPAPVIARAQKILLELSQKALRMQQADSSIYETTYIPACALSAEDHERYQRLSAYMQTIDLDVLSPRQALDAIWKLKDM